MNINNNIEIEKGTAHIIEIIEYVPNAIIRRTITGKWTGNVTGISMAASEE